jgi:anti-sigma factor RsiW
LPPVEHTHVEEHLQRCAQCQEEFTHLRQIITMLHALPRLELPRSFALPASTKVTPLATTARRSSTLRSAGRAISLLAAVVGIALLISSLPSLPSGGAMPAAGSSTGSARSTQATSHDAQPYGSSASNGTPSPNRHPMVTPQPANPLSTQPLSLLDLRSPSGRAIFGIVLLVIGLVGLLTLWRRRYSLP